VKTTADAAPEEIWRLFVDVERWPEMSQSTSEVRRLDTGPLRTGSEYMVRQPGLRKARWRVTAVDPGRSFTAEAAFTGMTSVAGHVVEPSGPGSVITISIRTKGPLGGFVGALLSRRALRSITTEMEGFRRTAEAAH